MKNAVTAFEKLLPFSAKSFCRPMTAAYCGQCQCCVPGTEAAAYVDENFVNELHDVA